MRKGSVGEARRLAAVLLTALGIVGGCRASDEALPNLLLVSIDTLRADHTSAYGYERETTPHLAALAGEGARFEQAYAPSATTAPSHATLFTGRPPIWHGVVKNGVPLAPEHPTVAEALAGAGYQTAGVVGSFVLDQRFGLGRGFEHWDDDFTYEGASFKPEVWEGIRVGEHGFDRRAGAVTDAALEWLLRGRTPERPFFLFVHFFDPHAPYELPLEIEPKFLEGSAEETRLERNIRLYDEEIRHADAGLGRLLEAIEAADPESNTIVVVMGDHGEGLMDHGLLMHGAQLYEEAVRVPLAIRWPGHVPGGEVVEEPVSLEDLAATILALTGVDAPPMPGRSLAGRLLDGATLDPGRPIFLFRRHYEEGMVEGFRVRGTKFGVRKGRWKYIDGRGEGEPELYDLRTDPEERRNRVSDERDRAEALEAILADWRASQDQRGDVPELSKEDREALEALGYLP